LSFLQFAFQLGKKHNNAFCICSKVAFAHAGTRTAVDLQTTDIDSSSKWAVTTTATATTTASTTTTVSTTATAVATATAVVNSGALLLNGFYTTTKTKVIYLLQPLPMEKQEKRGEERRREEKRGEERRREEKRGEERRREVKRGEERRRERTSVLVITTMKSSLNRQKGVVITH